MNGMTQPSCRELVFFRSFLESAPGPIESRPFSIFGATRPRDRTHSQLHQLKRKLLRAVLEESPEIGLFKRLCGAANQAAELAWATSNPLLVYPCLFDEMVIAVRERFQQEQMSDARSPLTSLDADLRFEDIHSISRGSDHISTWRVSLAACPNAAHGNRTAGQTARLPYIE